MCVKFPPEDLNPNPCPLHPTSIYTCGVTIAPRVHRGTISFHYHAFTLFFFFFFFENHLYTFLSPTVIYIENTYNTNALRWDTIYLFLVYTPEENLIPPLYLYLKGSNSAHSLKTICHFHKLQEIEIIKLST